jgi:hypothetical protein
MRSIFHVVKTKTTPVFVSEPISHELQDLTKTVGEYVLYNENAVARLITHAWGTYDYSMGTLSDEGLRPLTYQDALVLISKNVDLLQKVGGKWFWIAGTGLNASGYHTFDEYGNLSSLGQVREAAQIEEPEKTVRCYPGTGNQILAVVNDANLRVGRFHLHANQQMQAHTAPLILGVPKEYDIQSTKFVDEHFPELRRWVDEQLEWVRESLKSQSNSRERR